MTSDSDDPRRDSHIYHLPDAGTSPLAGFGFTASEGPTRRGRQRKQRRNGRNALIAGAAAVVVVAAALVIVKLSSGSTSSGGFVPSGSSPSQDGKQITTAFLRAWDSGNLQRAASYTDSPAAARAALTSYRKDLHLRKLAGSVSGDTAATAPTSPASGPGGTKPTTGPAASTTLESVTFALNATVASPDSATALPGIWRYHSSLVTYQQANSPTWYIEWAPDVVAPNLTASQHLAAASVPPTIVSVTDTSGNALTSYGDAGLNTISALLQRKGIPQQGKPGLNVQIETAAGAAVPKSQAVLIAPQNANLPTTIQPQAEQLARAAVMQKPKSSIVVIQPSTGDIIAIANNDGFNDFALTAAVAPGSTMKILTTTALFSDGFATADSPVACPPVYTVQGVRIHNDKGESEPASTPLWDDFAQSCNNAFTQWWTKLSATSASGSNKLAAAAKEYYGLDQQWDIGIGRESAQYFNAPPTASGSELAEEDFGEGQLTASPLAMASVAATVDNGSFMQPILVPGTKQITATPLSSSVDAQLKQEMRAVVTEGTAAGEGFGPDVYAKTGTADINGQEQPNSWFVAFEPGKDVAVAALDLNAGYGAQYAAPEVQSFLSQYSG